MFRLFIRPKINKRSIYLQKRKSYFLFTQMSLDLFLLPYNLQKKSRCNMLVNTSTQIITHHKFHYFISNMKELGVLISSFLLVF